MGDIPGDMWKTFGELRCRRLLAKWLRASNDADRERWSSPTIRTSLAGGDRQDDAERGRLDVGVVGYLR
jgi:hypothetical protein